MCKGYAEGMFDICQLATTSPCPQEDRVNTFNGDIGELDPTASCGEEGSWKGCFIKTTEGNKKIRKLYYLLNTQNIRKI